MKDTVEISKSLVELALENDCGFGEVCDVYQEAYSAHAREYGDTLNLAMNGSPAYFEREGERQAFAIERTRQYLEEKKSER